MSELLCKIAKIKMEDIPEVKVGPDGKQSYNWSGDNEVFDVPFKEIKTPKKKVPLVWENRKAGTSLSVPHSVPDMSAPSYRSVSPRFSRGLKMGLGVGLPAAAAGVGTAAYLLHRRRKKKAELQKTAAERYTLLSRESKPGWAMMATPAGALLGSQVGSITGLVKSKKQAKNFIEEENKKRKAAGKKLLSSGEQQKIIRNFAIKGQGKGTTVGAGIGGVLGAAAGVGGAHSLDRYFHKLHKEKFLNAGKPLTGRYRNHVVKTLSDKADQMGVEDTKWGKTFLHSPKTIRNNVLGGGLASGFGGAMTGALIGGHLGSTRAKKKLAKLSQNAVNLKEAPKKQGLGHALPDGVKAGKFGGKTYFSHGVMRKYNDKFARRKGALLGAGLGGAALGGLGALGAKTVFQNNNRQSKANAMYTLYDTLGQAQGKQIHYA